MKPSFELWDSESANYMGNLCVDRGALADIGKAFPTNASKSQILNLVLTVELDGDDDERWFSSTGRRYVRLVRRFPVRAQGFLKWPRIACSDSLKLHAWFPDQSNRAGGWCDPARHLAARLRHDAMIPGKFVDVAIGIGPDVSPGAARGQRARYGLDAPLPVQYLRWIGNVVRGRSRRLAQLRPAGGRRVSRPGSRRRWSWRCCATLVSLLIAIPRGSWRR